MADRPKLTPKRPAIPRPVRSSWRAWCARCEWQTGDVCDRFDASAPAIEHTTNSGHRTYVDHRSTTVYDREAER